MGGYQAVWTLNRNEIIESSPNKRIEPDSVQPRRFALQLSRSSLLKKRNRDVVENQHFIRAWDGDKRTLCLVKLDEIPLELFTSAWRVPGALCHIIVRGNANQPIFPSEIDRDTFLDLLCGVIQEAERAFV